MLRASHLKVYFSGEICRGLKWGGLLESRFEVVFGGPFSLQARLHFLS